MAAHMSSFMRDAAHHQPAAVHPVERRSRRRRLRRPVDADEHVVSVAGSGVMVLDGHVFRPRRPRHGGGQLGRAGAHCGEVRCQPGEQVVGHRPVHRQVLGVEAAGEVHGGSPVNPGRGEAVDQASPQCTSRR